ncbi:phosphoserine phosphatase SerB [Sphingobium sufflavum]|uniref:phosphoserine phosphatase SerB n=1 Tax=Sphingobium sufflavum TaxID=1129547 RepID=UPI001F18094C|nr:phosphoserine phosphatase SerB [Sphingobium sufflavum]MCE7798228.1 phosphoserine phosphatase SerB [Sphingobium sufflavum]
MFVATLIAVGSLRHEHIDAARAAIVATGAVPGETVWLDEGAAADIPFFGDLVPVRAALAALSLPLDFAVQPIASRDKRLLVADMDSTMITIECIDELADYAGIKPQIAEVTERAMRGELDFSAALTERVALLKGLDDSVIDICRAERVKLTPGAQTLVQTLRARGAYAVLVSGGFTRFAEPVGAEIGFNLAIANVLGIEDGKLTGTVGLPIVDAERKRTELLAHADALGIAVENTLAIGDGANDIPMIEAAGLGLAYHAKEKARAAADASISQGDLTAVLYMLGIAKVDWVAG